ncbi:MAG: pyruvoyl-dependent arginine decarboxylase [Fidelibacterota bacterium]
MIPKYYFLTKGQGRHKDYLQSFELALRNAGIQHCNLVTVSSILPPGCKKISRKKGEETLKPGQITYVVMSKNSTNEPNRLIAASVGIAIPADADAHGYVSEHHSYGQTDEVAGDYAEDLAATMLATTRGVKFDPEQAWDERKQIYRSSGMIIRTSQITQSAQGNKNGLWTTVLAAVVFVM